MTLAAVTAMVSTTELSDSFLMTRLPVPFWMASLKLTTRLAPTATPMALSAGLKLLAVGGVVSDDAKALLMFNRPPETLLPLKAEIGSVVCSSLSLTCCAVQVGF